MSSSTLCFAILIAIAFSLVESQPRNSTVNVYDFGAKGDGKSDDTAAFQTALNSFNGQGGIVFAPSGSYYFRSTLTIPKGVSLLGTYRSVPSHTPGFVPTDLPKFGTVLLPTASRGNENGTPFITLLEDSTLEGVTIYYPDQIPTQTPTPYPWTIDMTGNNPAVLDVECLNCFNAIRAVGSARHYIARVQGQPTNTGIFIDDTYDIGRIENVHWNPWYSSNKEYMKWQLVHGRAFVIARSDWEYVFNTFAFGYAIGYHFVASKEGSCNGNFLGIGADMAVNASVWVDAADPWGILITNGEFTSFLDPTFGSLPTNPAQVVVTGEVGQGSVRFSNSAFWGPSNNIARVASGKVAFSDCIFSDWDANGKSNYAIAATGGTVQVSNCDFQRDGNQIELGPGVSRATVIGNLFMGTERVHNQAQKSSVGLNVASA